MPVTSARLGEVVWLDARKHIGDDGGWIVEVRNLLISTSRRRKPINGTGSKKKQLTLSSSRTALLESCRRVVCPSPKNAAWCVCINSHVISAQQQAAAARRLIILV
jgi:hypothetical protein